MSCLLLVPSSDERFLCFIVGSLFDVRISPFTGVLNDDLADLEYLRELVLHGNNIYGGELLRALYVNGTPWLNLSHFMEMV